MKTLGFLLSSLVLAFNVNAAEILHYVDSDSGLVGAALTQVGETSTTTSHINFQTDLASQVWDLVIVDVPGSSVSSGNTTALDTYIDGGGLSVLSAYTYNSNAALGTAFDVAYASTFSSPLPVYIWSPAHPIFTGVTDITDYDQDAGDNGDKLDPINGAVSLAGFTAASAVGEAAIILGNGGRTIANGWLFWDAELTPNNITMVANQVQFLLGNLQPQAPAIPVPTVTDYGLVLLILGLLLMAARRLQVSTRH